MAEATGSGSNTPNSGETPRGLGSDELQALSSRVLELSSADQCRVSIDSGWRGYTRVAGNRITSAGGSEGTTVSITSYYGNRAASVDTNRLESADLLAAIRRSEELARLAPENPETMPELGPQQFIQTDAYYPATGGLQPQTRADAAALAIRQSQSANQIAASYMDVRAGTSAVATSNGLFGSHASSGVAYTLTSRSPDGLQSGWAGDEANDWAQLESQRVANDAVRKCQSWRKTDLAPGEYTVILEPTAVGMLLLRMLDAFNQRSADEGRSFFSRASGGNRLGENLFDPRVTLYSDPGYPDAETAPFDAAGLPRQATVWVNSGRLENLSRSRFWAAQQNQPALAAPANLIMQGGDDSIEEMIASTRRGVLITRFWYIRGLNPRIVSYTGLTRDGTFLIENGRISRPVNNFRFNQSLSEMLQSVEMVGQATRVAASENSSLGTPIVAPALKVARFNLSSVSDAI